MSYFIKKIWPGVKMYIKYVLILSFILFVGKLFSEDETSEVLHVRPDLVDMSKAVSHRVVSKFTIVSGNYREELLPSAMYGDPRKATEEKGQLIMEQAEEELIELINELERGNLPITRE